MSKVKEWLEVGFKFHGHRCPAMPLGLRAGLAAMKALGVERSAAHELHLFSETGKGHAAGCFLDGLMVATGCTYGKGNIEKKYYNKFAFTLVDVDHKREIRVSLKPDFAEKMFESPFVKLRKEGKRPQDIDPAVLAPLLDKVLSMPEENFLVIGEVKPSSFTKGASVFETKRCDGCGEVTFVNKLQERDGKLLCLGCLEKR